LLHFYLRKFSFYGASLKQQGAEEMSFIVVEHPIAGHNLTGIQKKVEIAFPDLLKACTIWQPK
jgi:hypothetical protein